MKKFRFTWRYCVCHKSPPRLRAVILVEREQKACKQGRPLRRRFGSELCICLKCSYSTLVFYLSAADSKEAVLFLSDPLPPAVSHSAWQRLHGVFAVGSPGATKAAAQSGQRRGSSESSNFRCTLREGSVSGRATRPDGSQVDDEDISQHV